MAEERGATVTWDRTEARLDKLTEDVAEIKGILGGFRMAFDQMDKRLGDLGSQMDKRLGDLGSQMDKRLGDLGSQMDKRLGDLGSQMDKRLGDLGSLMDSRLGDLSSQVDRRFSTVQWVLGLVVVIQVFTLGRLFVK